MGHHIINGEFQSDKYPTCPPGKVPLSVKDPMAQDLLWEYAQRRAEVDFDFSIDLEGALLQNGYRPNNAKITMERETFEYVKAIFEHYKDGHHSGWQATKALEVLAAKVPE